MDVSILFVFLMLFLVASISLFAVYKLGIREKSYEEALAEQRQQTSVLLGSKVKPKEKKNKKVGKKPKDKEPKAKVVALQENETDESEIVESNLPEKPHVEFKEDPEEVVPPVVKQKRVKKVRPILIKKEQPTTRVDLSNVDLPLANHFEENPPKDDLELLRLNSKDDSAKQGSFKEKRNISEAPIRHKKEKTIKPSLTNVPVQAPVVTEPVVKETMEKSLEGAPRAAPSDVVIIGNPGKEKKKKKSEFNTRQQLTSDRDGLLNSVRKAELSKTEIQMLIDLLLNKQLDGPETVVDDWTEGKSDPIQKLKRQLAEKEKLLEEEQQALVGAQAKLKEIRVEQQAERQQLQQKIRSLEEVAQARQLEVQAAANRLQIGAQKVQQLQAELNSEIMKSRKVMEDNAAIQRQLNQLQESESIMSTLRNDYDDLSTTNQQLRLELQQAIKDKEHQHQHFMVQLGNLENALEQQNELNRQLKDSNQKLERNLEIAVRQHDDWNIENTNLKGALQQQYEEKLKLEHTLHQMKEELHVITNEKIESTKIIGQLKTDLRTLNDQFSQMNGSSEGNKNYEVEILNLTNELSSVKNELTSARSQLQQADKKYKTELEVTIKQCGIIEMELAEQKNKNNELRIKNWKVMEAFRAAESSGMGSNTETLKLEIISKEQEAQKQFIQRLFPEIDGLSTVTSEDWQAEFGKLIKIYVEGLKAQQHSSPPSSPQKSEVAKLQSQLQHYKTIIDDTEGMLNKLQSHVEKEEINWRNQQIVKEVEIERLQTEISQLQDKLAEQDLMLSNEIDQKQQLMQSVHSRVDSSHQDQTATVEKLSEEVNRLRELLQEQSKNLELRVPIKAQNNCNNSLNGSNFVEASEL